MTGPWRKSSRSAGGTSSQCVETRANGPRVDVRDSKAPELGFLNMSASDWDALLTTVKK